MGARMEEYNADEIIVKEGGSIHRMYIVLEGKVVLYSDYGTEREYVIGAFGKGKTFGEMDIFSDGPNLYTAVAFTDVKLAWFEKNNLDSFIKGYPDQAIKMIENISNTCIMLSRNLKLAIDEVNEIKVKIPAAKGYNTQLSYEEIQKEMSNLFKGSGEYHFIKK